MQRDAHIGWMIEWMPSENETAVTTNQTNALRTGQKKFVDKNNGAQ